MTKSDGSIMTCHKMKQIASFFKEIVLNGNMNIAKTIQEFNKEFSRVEYSFDDYISLLK
jgi:hypothetical protein